jgi:hypothetical protein
MYVPDDVAQQIRARVGIKPFMEVVSLSEDEEAAANGDAAKLEEVIARNTHLPIPGRPHSDGALLPRGTPLAMLPSSSAMSLGSIVCLRGERA